MCDPVSMGMFALQAGGAYAGQKGAEASARMQGELAKQQAENEIKMMNFDFQNMEMERKDAFMGAVEEITQIRKQALQLGGSVESAIAEDGMSGRTANMIRRSVAGKEAQAVASVQSNYADKSNAIDLNKEYRLESGKATVAGIKAPPMPSRLSMYLNIASAGMGSYNRSQEVQTSWESKTGTYDKNGWKVRG